MLWAYIDESKTKKYRLAVTVIKAAEAESMRKVLLKLRLPGQARLHLVNERDSRRRLILSEIAKMKVATNIFESADPRPGYAREKCLISDVNFLLSRNVARVVIETDESIRGLDRKVIERALANSETKNRFSFDHELAKNEPLLWIPDAIAWSYSRGGEFKEKVKPMIARVTQSD